MAQYFIASLKHTSQHHEHIQWWQRVECGYTPVLGEYAGMYVYGYAVDLNDGVTCVAVPVEVVLAICAPEPYFRPGGRLYDQRGPVVDNTRANWKKLIKGSLQFGRRSTPCPRPFRGRKAAVPAAAHESAAVQPGAAQA